MTFTDMKAYCDLVGIFADEDRRDLVHFLREMDIIYLKRMHARIQKARDDAERKRKQEAERGKRRHR